MVKKSISITGQQNNWIAGQVATGQYGNESEVIRELIRERQNREQETAAEVETIRAHLVAAEKQGSSSVSREALLAEIKEDIRRNGRI